MISKVQRNGKQIRFKEVWFAKRYLQTDIALDSVNLFTDKEITGRNRVEFIWNDTENSLDGANNPHLSLIENDIFILRIS